jgi:hypothetical protein
MVARRGGWLLAAAVGLASCSRSSAAAHAPLLPAQSPTAVQAEEKLWAVLLARSGKVVSISGTCKVTLLGRDRTSAYVYADCTAVHHDPGSGPIVESASTPVKITGTEIETPGDGSSYGPDIRRMFPPAIAREIIEMDMG